MIITQETDSLNNLRMSMKVTIVLCCLIAAVSALSCPPCTQEQLDMVSAEQIISTIF